jgi:hypothetical protein
MQTITKKNAGQIAMARYEKINNTTIERILYMREVDLVITDLNQIIEDEVYALPPDQIAAVAEFLADKLNEIRDFSYE